MGVVSQSIPNFLNGMSQQTPSQRGINQGKDQINCQNNIVDGLSKRPALEYVATLDASNVFPNTTKIWNIQRDESNRYICAFYDNGVKVYDLAGNEKTVSYPDGNTYLNTTNPKADFRMVNIADYTFVVNKSIVPTADTTLSAAKLEEFHVYCKSTNYGREYKVALEHEDWAYEVEVIFQVPTGNSAATDSKYRDTNKIVDILMYGTASSHYDASANGIGFKTVRTDTGATLSTTSGLANFSDITTYFTVEQFDSVIYGTIINQAKTYTLSTSDGSGNTAMYGIRDTIQDFTKLPYYGKVGTIIKVTGDEGDTLSDYYVKFDGTGVWSETLAPATSLGLTDTTMPHALINNNDGTFTFQKLDWVDRSCGDSTDTNPNPSFVGKTIQNLTFYKNRLGILSGENLILAENASYFNFFATTVTQVLDTDPIDIAASGTQVNTLKNSVGFNETLLLFSDTAQYKLDHAGDTISPTTAILNEVSSFEHDDNVRPVAAGKFAYFAQARTSNTAIREYFSDDNTLTNDGLDISVAVQSLMPTNAYQIISNTVEDCLAILCSDTADAQVVPYATSSNVTATNADTMYIYKYFFDGGEKVQTAWSKWEFTGVKILGGFSIESNIYLFTAEGQTTKLFKVDLRNLKDATLGYGIYLDKRASATGTYSSGTDLTTVTSPYGAKTGLMAVDKTNGTDYALTSASGATCTITVSDAANIAVGSTIVITDNAGVSTTMTATNSDPASALEFSVGGSRTNDDVADNIAVGSGGVLGINNLAGYSAPNPAGGTPIITVTRAVVGDSNLTVTSSDPTRLAVTNFVAGNSFTLVGNHTSLFIGTPYESKYSLSTQYVRENTGRGLLAVTTGRYQVRNIALTYENSGFFTAEVTPENRSTSTTVMNGYVLGTSGSTIGAPALHSGTIKVPVQCRNTDFTFDIKSSSHLPMYVASAEVEGYYHNRATRI
jgi:hypothetical protein